MSANSGDKHRDSPISAEDIDDARPWRLPFWTEPPVHVVKREAAEDAAAEAKRRSLGSVKVKGTAKNSGGYPTAEELELIRREAYNDGLEQGRVEGRQEGHKDGYNEGVEQGRTEGHKEGFTTGKQEGINAGFAEGRANGVDEVTAEAIRLRAVVVSLQSSLRERDAQLPDVIVVLLTRLAEQVLKHELSEGAQAIQMYVDDAIAALPDGENLARVYVAAADAELLAPFADTVSVHIDKALSAGDCRIESQTSLIEYTTSDHFEQAILHLAERLLSTADGYPNDDEIDLATQPREFEELASDDGNTFTDEANLNSEPASESDTKNSSDDYSSDKEIDSGSISGSISDALSDSNAANGTQSDIEPDLVSHPEQKKSNDEPK